MKRNTIFLIDFWIVCVFFTFIISIQLFYFLNYLFYENIVLQNIFDIIYDFLNETNLLYTFIKSIAGCYLFIRILTRKQMIVTVNVLFFIIHFLFIGILIFILYVVNLELNDQTIDFMGLSINAYKLYKFAKINIVLNLIGLPLWLFYFTFSKDIINKNMIIILNIFTVIITIIMNIYIFLL